VFGNGFRVRNAAGQPAAALKVADVFENAENFFAVFVDVRRSFGISV